MEHTENDSAASFTTLRSADHQAASMGSLQQSSSITHGGQSDSRRLPSHKSAILGGHRGDRLSPQLDQAAEGSFGKMGASTSVPREKIRVVSRFLRLNANSSKGLKKKRSNNSSLKIKPADREQTLSILSSLDTPYEEFGSDLRTPVSERYGFDPSNRGTDKPSNKYHYINFGPAMWGFSGTQEHSTWKWGYPGGYDCAESRNVRKQTDDSKNSEKNEEKKSEYEAPEKRITTTALRLASLEKAARGMGALCFIWATVVILTSTQIHLKEFVVVLVIISAEASRLFSGNHEQELIDASFYPSPGKAGAFLSKRARLMKKVLGSLKKMLMQNPVVVSQPDQSKDQSVSPLNTNLEKAEHPVSIDPDQEAPIYDPHQEEAVLAQILVPDIADVKRGGNFDKLIGSWMSKALNMAQLVSASICMSLAIWRLVQQDFGKGVQLRLSLDVFYALAILEAGIFLLEICYREYKMQYYKLIENVLRDLQESTKEDDRTTGKGRASKLGSESKTKWPKSEQDMVQQFFHVVYSECLKGSVFESLDMGLVSFFISCLQSKDNLKQLGGARLLNRFVSSGRTMERPRRSDDPLAQDTLRQLATTSGVIERLVEMLSWDVTTEYPLLFDVSSIICRLVVHNQNCSRIVAVPGAMDAIVSLLSSYGKLDESNDSQVELLKAAKLRLTGLRTLRSLCRDHKNSLQVGQTRGLLPILVMLIEVRDRESTFEVPKYSGDEYQKDHLKTYKLSLQVLRLLSAATTAVGSDSEHRIGSPGAQPRGDLRHSIAAIVSSLRNMRDVIKYAKRQPKLQWLAADILYHLAMEDDLRYRIGSTGGVIRYLFKIFNDYDPPADSGLPANESDNNNLAARESRLAIMEKAGETLARLVLQNEDNCLKLIHLDKKMNGKMIPVFIDALDHAESTTSRTCSAAQILRSVLRYADQSTKAKVSEMSAGILLERISECHRLSTKTELYEAWLGLSSTVLESLDLETYKSLSTSVDRKGFMGHLMMNLRHVASTKKFPLIRRYSVELIVEFIQKDASFLNLFQRSGEDLREILDTMLDTISDVENYILFSGLVGYTRHRDDMNELVERAIKIVEKHNEAAKGHDSTESGNHSSNHDQDPDMGQLVEQMEQLVEQVHRVVDSYQQTSTSVRSSSSSSLTRRRNRQ